MAPKNCLNYSAIVWNNQYCKIIFCLDFIGLRVYSTPKGYKIKVQNKSVPKYVHLVRITSKQLQQTLASVFPTFK